MLARCHRAFPPALFPIRTMDEWPGAEELPGAALVHGIPGTLSYAWAEPTSSAKWFRLLPPGQDSLMSATCPETKVTGSHSCWPPRAGRGMWWCAIRSLAATLASCLPACLGRPKARREHNQCARQLADGQVSVLGGGGTITQLPLAWWRAMYMWC
ncbi:hypothetical protein LX36DRAFT_403196 [Colletotrichum falcatum]|nr:hypothetical protein LX36DRAFT_403196 [Colletotrichum falcatum]